MGRGRKTTTLVNRKSSYDSCLEFSDLVEPIWEKQEHETGDAYIHFRDYLRFDGKIRTLCANEGLKAGTPEFEARVRSFYQLGARLLWQKRRDAWLINENKLKNELFDKEKKKKLLAIEKNMFIAEQTVINILTEFVKRQNSSLVSFDKVDAEKQYQIALKAVEQLGKISEMTRKALGEPTENIKSTVEIKGGLENLQTLVVKSSHSKLLDSIPNDSDPIDFEEDED
jgi:hypothetical protein